MAPWRQLFRQGYRQHLFWGAAVGLGLFWQMHVDVLGLFGLHPLIMMSVVMVFGCALGLWVGALALMLGSLFHVQPWTDLAVQFCLNVLIPALVAAAVLMLIERLPFRNLFVYMLGGGFIGAMVTVQAMAASSWLYVWLFGPEPLLVIISDYYYLTLLMMFPEGFINGAMISTLTVLAPHLVKTYDDHRYLDDD
ncbi:energy-coupling factor ABC transporter permease [Pseudomaricurvus hydrocarbonicus]